MKVYDAGDGSSSRKSRWSKRLPQLAKDHSARAGRKVVQPKDSSADSKATRHLGRSDALDREVKGTRQDRSGAREPVQKSASASRSMTHSAPKFLRSPDEEEEKVLDRDPATNASQDGPTRPTDSGEKSGQVQLLGGTTDSDSTEDKGLEAKESQFRADVFVSPSWRRRKRESKLERPMRTRPPYVSLRSLTKSTKPPWSRLTPGR